jgi:hypothetical protein
MAATAPKRPHPTEMEEGTIKRARPEEHEEKKEEPTHEDEHDYDADKNLLRSARLVSLRAQEAMAEALKGDDMQKAREALVAIQANQKELDKAVYRVLRALATSTSLALLYSHEAYAPVVYPDAQIECEGSEHDIDNSDSFADSDGDQCERCQADDRTLDVTIADHVDHKVPMHITRWGCVERQLDHIDDNILDIIAQYACMYQAKRFVDASAAVDTDFLATEARVINEICSEITTRFVDHQGRVVAAALIAPLFRFRYNGDYEIIDAWDYRCHGYMCPPPLSEPSQLMLAYMRRV